MVQFFVCGDRWSGDPITGSCGDDRRKDNAQLMLYIIYTAVAVHPLSGLCYSAPAADDADDDGV